MSLLEEPTIKAGAIPPENEPQEESTNPNQSNETPTPSNEAELPPEAVNANELLDKLDEKTKVLTKTIDNLNGFFKGFEATVDKINKRMDMLEDKLPKTISKPKPAIKGYYNWDEKTNTFINQAAKTEYAKAKETIDIINSLVK